MSSRIINPSQKDILYFLDNVDDSVLDNLVSCSELTVYDSSTFEGRDAYIESFMKTLKLNHEDASSLFRAVNIIMKLSLDFEDLKQFLISNHFSDKLINKILKIKDILTKIKLIESYAYFSETEFLKHTVLPHLHDTKYSIDFRLNDVTSKLVPVVICNLVLHKPSHKSIENDLYFQITPEVLDAFISDLTKIKHKLEKDSEHLNTKLSS